MTETYQPGIYVDFTSKTVTLCGSDIVDRIFECMLGNVTPEKVVAAANILLAIYHPDYDRGDESWSLGSDDQTVEHFKQALGDGFVITQFSADGGK